MKQKRNDISILIPTYNTSCATLVGEIYEQAEILGINYEIIVAEDGSTDTACIKANEEALAPLPLGRHLVREKNVGRAAIRNFLASESKGTWLLFIDSDMTVNRPDFLQKYLEADDGNVIDGGVSIDGNSSKLGGNLRFLYEKAAAQEHTAKRRSLRPYHHLHTANLMVRRDVMLSCPFDERFRHYGYEDVLLGKQLRQQRVPILHIDNPLSFSTFEANRAFVSKTEEGIRTLHEFRDDLRGYSSLLTLAEGIHVAPVRWLLQLLFRLFAAPMRRNLCGSRPCIRLFKLYKLGYYLTLK